MASTAEKKETARDVAVAILKEKGGGPIKVVELAKAVVESGRTKLTGKTPEATVAAHIYTAAKKGVLFEKTGRGEVRILPDAPAETPAPEKRSRRGAGAAAASGKDGKAKNARGSGAKPKAEQTKPSGGRGRGGRPTPSDDIGAGDKDALAAAGEHESLTEDLLRQAGGGGEPAEAETVQEPALVG